MSSALEQGLHALSDRAYCYVATHGSVTEEALLTHVYGGHVPPRLGRQLAAPLLEDPRLERQPDGHWSVAGRSPTTTDPGRLTPLELTTLAVLASGPSPDRGRLVRLCAARVQAGNPTERFEVTLNPGQRVPRYVTERLGLAPELLDELPRFATVLDELVAFLGRRPVLAQDARLTWGFVSAEARRAGRLLAEPLLVDANELVACLLDLDGKKPSLALAAARLGIGSVRIARPEEEARVLGSLAGPLLQLAEQHGYASLDALLMRRPENETRPVLRRRRTAASQPDQPGVYVLRAEDQTALYVGKARRLRSRLSAYVNRPLGITRRLEGLVGAVEAVDATLCATDLEALVLEVREIRRLQPRYNTVRQQRTPRLWIRLPPVPLVQMSRGKRDPAPRRLEPSLGPGSAEGEFVGPFRNEAIAEHARLLARAVFELDSLRRGDRQLYEDQLRLAWHFLHVGNRSEVAEERARRVGTGSTRLLPQVLAFDPTALLLPADPREASYVVVRPGPTGVEGFLLERGLFRTWSLVKDEVDVGRFASELVGHALTRTPPRTGPEDTDVVLRWFGAQRPPAVLIHVPQDALAAADAIEAAALALLQTRTAGFEDPPDPLV